MERLYLYSRTMGLREWWCPFCRRFNQTRMRRDTFHVACGGWDCRRQFIAGEVLWLAPPGIHAPPFDRVAPLFDVVHPAKWRSGQPANRLVLLPEDLERLGVDGQHVDGQQEET